MHDLPPLSGVRVIDLSTSYAGPTGSMYLADLGADVIKVERPETGDDSRHWGPPFLAGEGRSESAWFCSANRNKRSVCIDIASSAGRAELDLLLSDADIAISNTVPPKLARLGLDPEAVATRHPRLVYALVSGYGQDGPDRDLPGYDLTAQARSGLMSITGEMGRSPQRMSTALTDIVAGIVLAMVSLAALRRRDLTGRGEVIDVGLLDVGLALMAPRVASFLAGEPEPRPSGATDSVLSVYRSFETLDAPIVVAVGNDAMWRRLVALLGDDRLAGTEYETNDQRRLARPHIYACLEDAFRRHGREHWLEVLAAIGVPAAPIQCLGAVVADPQVLARRSIAPVAHDGIGDVPLVTEPWRLLNTAPAPRRGAPRLGEHTESVLSEHASSQGACPRHEGAH